MYCSMFFLHRKLNRRSHNVHNRDGNANHILLVDPTSKLNSLIDTGADISVLTVSYAKQNAVNEGLVLYAANGTKLQTFGTKLLILDLNLLRSFTWSFV